MSEWIGVSLDDLSAPIHAAIVDGPFGSNLKTSDYVEEGVPVLQGNNITGNKFVWKDVRYISDEKAKELKRSAAKVGDVLIVKIGSVGYVGIIDDLEGHEFAIIPANLIKASFDNGKVETKYIYYVLTSEIGNKLLLDLATNTAQPALSLKSVKSIKINIPEDLHEQQKIAHILTTVDNLIEKTQSLIDKYTAVKQGMMHDLFTRGIDLATGQLRPSYEQAPELYKETELGWVPRGWGVSRMEDVLSRIIDYRGKTPVKTEEGVPLITAKNVRLGYIDPEPREFIAEESFDGWMTRGMPKKGDILFTTEAPLANVAQIETAERLAFAQRTIILQANENTDPTYLKYALLSEDFRGRVFSKGSGSTVEGIQQSQFRKLKIGMPESKTEQLAASKRLTSIDKMIDAELILLEKAKIQKKGLMQDLLTGRVRVDALAAMETPSIT